MEALGKLPQDWPEVEYMGMDSITNGLDPLDGFNYGTMAVGLVAPQSRGSVTINSANTADPPLIDLGFFTNQADVDIMLAGIERVRDLWSATNITIGPETLPGPNIASRDDLLQYSKSAVQPLGHASSTCAMGKASDPNAVVDSKARVIGTRNLRVVDASIFPFLPPGHPQSLIYALAEKLADDILPGPPSQRPSVSVQPITMPSLSVPPITMPAITSIPTQQSSLSLSSSASMLNSPFARLRPFIRFWKAR